MKPTIKAAFLLAAAFSAMTALSKEDDGTPGIRRFQFANLEAPVFYNAAKPIEDGSRAEIAVVFVHGWGSGVNVAASEAPLALALKAATEPGKEPPYVVAPLFPRHATMKRANVAPDDRAVWNVSWGGDLKRRGSPADDWRGGGDAVGTHLSSYDVIDRIFAAFGDVKRFPNLKRVVMTGYSAGGQFVGRYAAVGKGFVRNGVTLEYAAMAPSTELLLDPDTIWHYGLKDRPRYSAGLTRDQILRNLSSRRVWRGCGDKDTKGIGATSLDSCPAAMAQGANRYLRFLNFKAYIHQFPEWEKQVSFHVFRGMGHENVTAHRSKELISFIVGK